MRSSTHKACKLAIASLVGIGFGLSSTVQASGFRIPELSTAGTGTANALVANTELEGAFAYNPATMSFHSGNSISAGITRIDFDLSVNPTGGTPTDNAGEDTFYVPNLFVAFEGHGNMHFGLAINAPFGLETSWPAGTFPNIPAAPLEPATSRIEMVNVSPNLAWRIDDSSSVSFGLNFYQLRDLVFNTHQVKIDGRGDGLGWNLGYVKKLNNLNFGIAYRSSVKVDLTGVFDASTVPPDFNPPMSGSASLEFPDMLQAGVYYQVTPAFGLEFDVERTGWSSFDRIVVKNSAGQTLTTSVNNWDDVWAYRLGAVYQLNPNMRLLFGYAFDETGQPDAHFSARVPDQDRNLYSIGVNHTMGDWTLEAAFMHVKFDDRTVASTTTYNPGVNPDPNGTTAYNGVYNATVNLLSLGATLRF